MNLPKEFQNKMKQLLDTEYNDFISSFDDKPHKGIRINTSKISIEQFIKAYPYELKQIPWCNEGFYVNNNGDIKLGKHPYYHCGLYYIQEPSAMIPVEVLSPKQGDKVLDICAAPGGKSTQMAAKLSGEGIVVSNDISPKRVKSLAKNIKIMGIANSVILNESPKNLSKNFAGFFDKILVDAPCSGEGMFKRDSVSIKKWSKDSILEYSKMQREILEYAPKMLKSNGTIVYSTCTFSPEEDEGTINWFLNKFPDFHVEHIANMPMLDNGHPEWIDASSSLVGAKRAWPHKITGDGHFVVLLKRKSTQDVRSSLNKLEASAPKELIDKYLEFQQDYLNKKLKGIFIYKNSNLYLLPEHIPSLNNLKVEYMGLLVGTFKNDNFIPSQELIMSLKFEDFKQVLNISSSDINATKYLKGETLMSPIENNFNKWVPIFIDSHPAGWTKNAGGILKNHYNKAWRMK